MSELTSTINPVVEQEAQSMHKRGQRLFHEGKNEDALQRYERAIELVGEENTPW